jgi:nucleoside-diphosphate-sugar epimerase
MGDVLPNEVVNFMPESLIHLAWNGIPDFSDQRCIENLQNQIRFFKETENLTHLKKIIGAGTCREYGSKIGVCFESDRMLPDNYFSWAKLALSEYLWVLCKQRMIAFVWFRIFYVYGPGQRSESLIPSVIRAYDANLIPNIINPDIANDYIYIDDVIDAFIKAVENHDCHGTFNLGTGIATTAARIEKIIEKILVNRAKLTNQPRVLESIFQPNEGMRADIKLSSLKLNWVPKIDITEGINRTINASIK